jgi:nucleoside-diphosphate-sugar epimerase
MALHVVVGKGAVGTTIARLLAQQGHQVRVVSRSGGPSPTVGSAGGEGIEHIRADAADTAALTGHARGAVAIYNCVNPPYHRWPTEWPPMATAMLDAAEATGAVLVITGNLYGYGPVSRPMTEDMPLAATGTKGQVRARMWTEALERYQAGRVRVTEARSSDYFGPLVTDQGQLGQRIMPKLLRGRSVSVIGDPDAPHSWTYIPDVAAAMATLATDERAWGRPWHVPSAVGLSQRQMITALAEAAATGPIKVSAVPAAVLSAAGLVVPLMRELREVRYQFDRPFLLDSSAYESTFGGRATPLAEAVAATVAWWRERLAAV